MLKNTFYAIVGLAGVCVGCIGVGYAIGAHRKMNDVCEKIDESIETLCESTPVEIADAVVNEAVKKAADIAATDAVDWATKEVIRDTKRYLRDKIDSAVEDQYSSIRDSVAKEIKKKVPDIDMDLIKQEVIKQVKEDASEKLNDSLDDVLTEFKDKLESITKIYTQVLQLKVS